MKKILFITGVSLLLAGLLFADVTWDTFQAEDFNIQFQIPENWTVETDDDQDVPSLFATNPKQDIALVVLVYKDESISTEELFDQAVDNLDMELEGEAEETEINGMNAWVGVGAGLIDDEAAGIVVMAATFDENNYVAYIFTEADAFEKRANLMEQIINSFAPIED